MESLDDDEDLKLVKASAGLLSDLETALPKLLWKRVKTDNENRRVHSQVKQRDLDYVIRLVLLSYQVSRQDAYNYPRSINSKANHNSWMQD